MTREPSRFWDKHAKGYAERPIADEESYQKKLQITQGYLRPDMRVLEFGCGTGSTAIAHAPYVQHIQAIDISAKMLEIAHGKAEAAGIKNVTFSQSAIEEFEAPSDSFDAVLGLSILHLLEDKDAAICKVYGLIKQGGHFVSSTGCLGDKMKFFKLIAPIGKFFGLMPLVKVFSTQDLIESLKAAGFAIDHHWKPEKGVSVFIVAKRWASAEPCASSTARLRRLTVKGL